MLRKGVLQCFLSYCISFSIGSGMQTHQERKRWQRCQPPSRVRGHAFPLCRERVRAIGAMECNWCNLFFVCLSGCQTDGLLVQWDIFGTIGSEQWHGTVSGAHSLHKAPMGMHKLRWWRYQVLKNLQLGRRFKRYLFWCPKALFGCGREAKM